MGVSDAVYWALKIYFSMIWIIYIASLFFKWNESFMWHVNGVLSIAYFAINVRWRLRHVNNTSKMR